MPGYSACSFSKIHLLLCSTFIMLSEKSTIYSHLTGSPPQLRATLHMKASHAQQGRLLSSFLLTLSVMASTPANVVCSQRLELTGYL